jgi:hypothetical protein
MLLAAPYIDYIIELEFQSLDGVGKCVPLRDVRDPDVVYTDTYSIVAAYRRRAGFNVVSLLLRIGD